jgi:hypothetical protein
VARVYNIAMTRWIFLFSLASALFAQSPDAVLTQTLISEIRALRQEIEATTVTSQRVQIALYRLQSQTALVDGAQRRLDGARVRVQEVQANRRRITSEIEGMEAHLRTLQNGEERQRIERALAQMKTEADAIAVEEGQRRNAEADADAQVRTEQGKLAELQFILDRLDRALDELSRAKK